MKTADEFLEELRIALKKEIKKSRKKSFISKEFDGYLIGCEEIYNIIEEFQEDQNKFNKEQL